jgi:putative MATE family efflux protein
VPRRPEARGPAAELDFELSESEDPEAAPAIPAASVAAHAAGLRRSDARTTDREIWTLAWPVILSQVLASAVSLIDIAMLGRLGPHALAAVGYTTQFFWLSHAVLMAVGVAGVALMARAYGAGDPARARAALAGCLGVALGVSGGIVAVVLSAPRTLLALLNATPEVIETALPYLRLTLLSTLLFAVSITLESGFRAARDTRTPLAVAVAVTVVKTVLNGLLIFGWLGFPRWGLVGAGVATLAAQVLAIALLFAASRRRPALALGARDFARARHDLGTVLRIASPAILERVVLNLALMDYFALLGHYGASALAAYTVGVRILSFSWIPGTGFAAAAATLVGHALGAADPRAATRAGWRAVRFALLVSAALGVAFAAARLPVARLFTDDPGVVETLGPFMLTLALTQPLLGLHFTLSGALRGAGDTVSPLLAATIGNWGFRVPLAFLFQRLGLELGWMWLALVVDHVARAVWVVVAFSRGRWRTRLRGAEARLAPR